MMPQLHLPWLELSIVTPLLGSLWMSMLRNRELTRKLCILVCLLTMTFAIGEWLDFISLGTFEAHDRGDILAFVFHRDFFVVDELSTPCCRWRHCSI